jgi:hypothetical protein
MASPEYLGEDFFVSYHMWMTLCKLKLGRQYGLGWNKLEQ